MKFEVHVKENQKLKHLNSDGAHAKCCMKAIPNGLFKRLAKLTSVNDETTNYNIDDMCPAHAEALRIAGLTPKQFPTFKETSMNVEQDKQQKQKRGKGNTTNLDPLVSALVSVRPGCTETHLLMCVE